MARRRVQGIPVPLDRCGRRGGPVRSSYTARRTPRSASRGWVMDKGQPARAQVRLNSQGSDAGAHPWEHAMRPRLPFVLALGLLVMACGLSAAGEASGREDRPDLTGVWLLNWELSDNQRAQVPSGAGDGGRGRRPVGPGGGGGGFGGPVAVASGDGVAASAAPPLMIARHEGANGPRSSRRSPTC